MLISLFLFIILLIIYLKLGKIENDLLLLTKEFSGRSNNLLKSEADVKKEESPPIPINKEPEVSMVIPKKEPVINKVIRKEDPVIKKKEVEIIKTKPKTVKKVEPTFFETLMKKAISKVKSYFTEGNILVRVGGVILFFGFAFLLKYAAQHSTVSLEFKLIVTAIASLSFVALGWKLRDKEGGYGLVIQGLGIAISYLVVFVSAKYFEIISLDIAFIFMLILVSLGTILAIAQNSLSLALFALTGGFASPILVSDGTVSHISLFSYYTILNIGIVSIAWFKSWRILNLVGFFFTFGVAAVWGLMRYEPSLLNSTEPFLIIFFLIFFTVSVIFTLKQPFKKAYLDTTLVFGLPMIAFPMQMVLIDGFVYGVAYSAVTLGSLYLITSKILFNRKEEKSKLLAQTFLAIGLFFYTMSIAFIFSDKFTGAFWAIEGAAIIWIALKQDRLFTRYIGLLLQVVGIAFYIKSTIFVGVITPFFNSTMFGYLLILIATSATSFLLYSNKDKLRVSELFLPRITLILSISLWFAMGYIEELKITNSFFLFISLTSVAFALVSIKLKWKDVPELLNFYFIFGTIVTISIVLNNEYSHLLEGIGAISFPLFFITNYGLMYLFKGTWKDTIFKHIFGLWLFSVVLVFEVNYMIQQFNLDTSSLMFFNILALLSVSIVSLKIKSFPSIFKEYEAEYKSYGAGVILFFATLLSLISFGVAGNPKSYIPLFNLLDIIEIASLLTVGYWVYTNKILFTFGDLYKKAFIGLSGYAFIIATIIFTRSVHFYGDVNYSMSFMVNSLVFQSGLSILWSLIAILVMLGSKKYDNRNIWIAGVSLLSVVVVKLFFFELAGSGTIERIVSFLGVGAIFLIVGYFAPIPPKKKEIIDEK